jgi:hypothetical protein
LDEVASLPVYVLRAEIDNPESIHEWTEQSYSPKTGYAPLRTVVHLRDGSEVRIEAIRVEFREVPDTLNDDMSSSPPKKP